MSERYFKRELLDELKEWMPRREILAIKGPRQSGKTTLMRMLSEWLEKEKGISREELTTLTFEDLEILESFITSPKEYIESFISGKKHYFFLDEFHYADDGGRKLKLLYDTVENAKFIVSGSSSLEITEFSKHLVGRVFSFNLFPFSFWEFLNARDERTRRIYEKNHSLVMDFMLEGKDFHAGKDVFIKDVLQLYEEYVIFGGYPEVVKARDNKTKIMVLKNLYETYVTKDISGLLRIHDIFKFKKLVAVLGSQLGGIVNYNDLAVAVGSYYKDIVGLLNTLEETYVIRLLRPFYRNLKTELRKNPKLYFIDPGLRNYAVSDFNALETRSDKGSLVENAVYNSLARAVPHPARINYWRTLSKAEVDFIVSAGNEIIPVEVKFSPLREPKVSRSFRSFVETYKPQRALVATRDFWGERKINKTNIKFIPACYL